MRAATDTTIIGAGQAGLSLSRVLADAGADHIVVDRGRIGERWRSERWPSLHLLTPNWLNVLTGSEPHADPDGFLSGRELVAYFERYAASFRAPVLEHTTVIEVRRRVHGFAVRTTAGTWHSRNVVIASGDAAWPALPAIAAALPPRLHALHTNRYGSPDEFPDGAVLVVGAGPSGQQIARELRRAGRDVVLSTGGHKRLPRRYRGRDIFSWLELAGMLDETIDDVPDAAAARRARSLPLSGARGGERLDLGALSELGVVCAGRLTGFDSGRAHFAADLDESVAKAEADMRALLERFDAIAARQGLDVPGEDIAPVELPRAPESIDLRAFGAVVWATGYRRGFPWLRVPVLDASGGIVQHRGATAVPGLYTLGMKFQWRRRSHFIGGVGMDAADIAECIVDDDWRLGTVAA